MNKVFVAVLLLPSFIFAQVDDSVILLMEKYESLENLVPAKYSKKQFSEIRCNLMQKDKKIRVASYNVLFPLYDHNLAPENRWPSRLPRVAEMIEEISADILGVQELYGSQLEELLPKISPDYVFFSHPCKDGEMNGIFYKKRRFELVGSMVWYMRETASDSSSETLTMVELCDKKTNKTFFVFNAHFAFSNIEKRQFQAEFVAKKVALYSKRYPVIFMGDLNTFPSRLDLQKFPAYDGDYVHKTLTEGGLCDAKERSLLGHLGPISTFTNEGEDSTPFKGKGTPGVFLDHIYVTKGIKVLMHAVQSGKVEGHFPSDHMPVVVDFLIKS